MPEFMCDFCEETFTSPVDCAGDSCNSCDEGYVYPVDENDDVEDGDL